MPLQELLDSVASGERLGFRLRIKPSWSGRVYGTYSIGWRLLAAGALCLATTGALFLRLLAVNLTLPGHGPERAALARSRAHGLAQREVQSPAESRELEQRAEEMFGEAYRLRTILGLHEVRTAPAGIGRMDGEESAVGPLDGALSRLNKVGGDVALLETQFHHLGVELDGRHDELRYTPSVVPLYHAEFVATSGFGPRISPFTRLPEVHRGQDLAADTGTKIVATADGVVSHVDRDGSGRMGRYVVLDHGGRYQTYYAHCDRVFVEPGDVIRRHQIIGEVGSTGRSTGPHVHYEVRVAGETRRNRARPAGLTRTGPAPPR